MIARALGLKTSKAMDTTTYRIQYGLKSAQYLGRVRYLSCNKHFLNYKYCKIIVNIEQKDDRENLIFQKCPEKILITRL
jgi:hypothetical protein